MTTTTTTTATATTGPYHAIDAVTNTNNNNSITGVMPHRKRCRAPIMPGHPPPSPSSTSLFLLLPTSLTCTSFMYRTSVQYTLIILILLLYVQSGNCIFSFFPSQYPTLQILFSLFFQKKSPLFPQYQKKISSSHMVVYSPHLGPHAPLHHNFATKKVQFYFLLYFLVFFNSPLPHYWAKGEIFLFWFPPLRLIHHSIILMHPNQTNPKAYRKVLPYLWSRSNTRFRFNKHNKTLNFSFVPITETNEWNYFLKIIFQYWNNNKFRVEWLKFELFFVKIEYKKLILCL